MGYGNNEVKEIIDDYFISEGNSLNQIIEYSHEQIIEEMYNKEKRI